MKAFLVLQTIMCACIASSLAQDKLPLQSEDLQRELALASAALDLAAREGSLGVHHSDISHPTHH